MLSCSNKNKMKQKGSQLSKKSKEVLKLELPHEKAVPLDFMNQV